MDQNPRFSMTLRTINRDRAERQNEWLTIQIENNAKANSHKHLWLHLSDIVIQRKSLDNAGVLELHCIVCYDIVQQ